MKLYQKSIALTVLAAASTSSFAAGVDLTGLQAGVSAGLETVGPAILAVAVLFIAVRLTIFAIAKVRGQVK